MSDFVRGGQLGLHSIRMLLQVIKPVLICSIIVWVLIASVILYVNLTFRHVEAFETYIMASWYNLIGLGKVDLKLFTTDTTFYTVKASNVPNIEYIGYLVLETKAIIYNGIFLSFLSTLVLAIFMTILVSRLGREKADSQHLRGARIIDKKLVIKAIEVANDKEQYRPYFIAGMPYPKWGENEHTIVVGTTGAGKTVLISDIVEQIRARGDQAIIYDNKGCYVEWFYNKHKDYILNPFDKRSQEWSLLNETEHIAHIKSIAESFIPQGKDKTAVWNEAGRIAFSSIVEKLISQNASVTNREIVDLIMRHSIKEVEELVKGTYARSVIDTKAPETAASVIFTLGAYFNSLRLTNGSQEQSFSIKNWASEAHDSFLFITSKEDLAAELVPLQTAWWEIAFKSLLNRNRDLNKKIWIILDEVASLNKIPSLQDAISKVREYGGCFVLGMQNIAQIEEIYGRGARTISSLCNTRCIFRTKDPETAIWMSKNIGEQEIEEFKEGLSYGAHQMRDGVSVNKTKVFRPLVMPAEIQNLPKLHLFLQMPDYPFVRTELQYKERKKINEHFIENKKLIEELKDDIKDHVISAPPKFSGKNDENSQKPEKASPNFMQTSVADKNTEGIEEVMLTNQKNSKNSNNKGVEEYKNETTNKYKPGIGKPAVVVDKEYQY